MSYPGVRRGNDRLHLPITAGASPSPDPGCRTLPQRKALIDHGFDEIPDELIQKADIIVHQVSVGFRKMGIRRCIISPVLVCCSNNQNSLLTRIVQSR